MKLIPIEDNYRYYADEMGSIWSIKSNKITKLSGGSNKSGYRQVSLRLKNKMITRGIHRLVALTFLPNPENKPQVNHINGLESDNRVGNLEWCTASENMRHSYTSMFLKKIKRDKRPQEKWTTSPLPAMDLVRAK